MDRLHDIITGIAMPDAPPAAPALEPLPHADSGKIVGLLEYLDARGRREDVFRIASDTNREFDRLISVVNAAELLDLVDTPKRTALLSAEGAHFVKASSEDRKALWREYILRLRLFQHVHEALVRQARHRLDRDFVLEVIALHMPNENYDTVFETFVNWSRFGDLFWYDDKTETLGLQRE